jgi:hypothetical protein
MIVVKLIGGLGNQMFQYAAGRSLALVKKTSLALDRSFLDKETTDYTKREFALHEFKIEATVGDEKLQSDFSMTANKVLLKFKAFFPKFFKHVVHYESKFLRKANFFSLPDNTYLRGYWQDSFYFSSIRKQLLKDFELKHESAAYLKIKEQIKKCNSVSVHIRRGDYISLASANEFHGSLSLDYYIKAFKKVQANHQDLSFFVFSDDPDWCSKHIDFLPKCMIVSKSESFSPHEELKLMSYCSHNIIANSSFSWWASWLNENPLKMVIAPSHWYSNTPTRKLALKEPEWELV